MGYRRMAGYQPELVCLLSWLPNDKLPILTDISINSKYGLYESISFFYKKKIKFLFLFNLD
jgi:hypothetical protein